VNILSPFCCHNFRDSGSKLKRLGLASVLKIGQPFPGLVLSSEASICVSRVDLSIVEQHGISGINCSWNRYVDLTLTHNLQMLDINSHAVRIFQTE